jgi:hypothetical protein
MAAKKKTRAKTNAAPSAKAAAARSKTTEPKKPGRSPKAAKVAKARAKKAASAAVAAPDGRPSTLRDPTLGTLRYDEELTWYEGRAKAGKGLLRFHVAVEDGELAPLLARTRRVLARMDALEKVAKKHAASELLAFKNEHWSTDDEPEVTERTFCSRMKLESVKVSGPGDVTFFFRDGDLFLGHAILVELGPDDTPSHADIAG